MMQNAARERDKERERRERNERSVSRSSAKFDSVLLNVYPGKFPLKSKGISDISMRDARKCCRGGGGGGRGGGGRSGWPGVGTPLNGSQKLRRGDSSLAGSL